MSVVFLDCALIYSTGASAYGIYGITGDRRKNWEDMDEFYYKYPTTYVIMSLVVLYTFWWVFIFWHLADRLKGKK